MYTVLSLCYAEDQIQGPVYAKQTVYLWGRIPRPPNSSYVGYMGLLTPPQIPVNARTAPLLKKKTHFCTHPPLLPHEASLPGTDIENSGLQVL